MRSTYTPNIVWATLYAVCMFITTTTTIMAGMPRMASPWTITMALLSILIMRVGTAMKKILKSSMSSIVQMGSDVFFLRTKYSKSHDIVFTKNMKKVLDDTISR